MAPWRTLAQIRTCAQTIVWEVIRESAMWMMVWSHCRSIHRRPSSTPSAWFTISFSGAWWGVAPGLLAPDWLARGGIANN